MSRISGNDLRLVMDDNAYRLRSGHRLQLQIQSSDFPYYAAHPGTGENPWTTTEKAAVDHSIRIGTDNGARLTLPAIRLTSVAPA